MGNPDSSFARCLVAYYGFIQAAHLIVLVRAAALLILNGGFGFPAPPPPGGWSPQTEVFLVGIGAADAVNAVIAFAFVYGYFSRARWWSWVGAVTLAIAAYSAVVFVYGTIASGAWAHNPLGYLSVASAFVPVAILMVLFGRWVLEGRLHESRNEHAGDSA